MATLPQIRLLALTLAIMVLWTPAMACTVFVITPGASADGSMYTGHTNDGFGTGVVGHKVSRELPCSPMSRLPITPRERSVRCISIPFPNPLNLRISTHPRRLPLPISPKWNTPMHIHRLLRDDERAPADDCGNNG